MTTRIRNDDNMVLAGGGFDQMRGKIAWNLMLFNSDL